VTSFLLAHCGGGQDEPGCLGPSAEPPAFFFAGKASVLKPFPQSSQRVLAFPGRYPNNVRCLQPNAANRRLPLGGHCTLVQAIPTALLGEDVLSPAENKSKEAALVGRLLPSCSFLSVAARQAMLPVVNAKAFG
jgi:hypothetical protein